MKKGHEILNVDGVDIEISNRAKLIFPEDGITKGNLISYYHDIAETMLPYLRDRLPDAELHVYEGADHSPHQCDRDRFIHDLLHFIDRS